MLSGENYAILSSRLPMLAHLENVLEESGEDAKLTAEPEGRYGNDADQRMMHKATLLAPTYREDHMKPWLIALVVHRFYLSQLQSWLYLYTLYLFLSG